MARKIATIQVDLEARTAAFKSAMADATRTARQSAQQMRSQMLEARGGFMLLGEEVGVRMPRHLQRFLAELPGVAPAMSAAFSGIAVAALGMVVFRTGEKIAAFTKHVREVGKNLTEGFGGMHEQAQKANDELAVTNDRLEMQIAKLEGKHGNQLKLELDEDRVAADDLALAAQRANKEITALLEKNKLGWFAAAMSGGKVSTKDQAALVQSVVGEIDRVTRQGQATLHSLGPDDDVKAAQAHNNAMEQEKLAWALGKVNKAIVDLKAAYTYQGPGPTKGKMFGDISANLAILEGAQSYLLDRQDALAERNRNVTDKATLTGLEANKGAAEKQLKLLESGLKAQLAASTNGHEALVLEERNYWQKHISEFGKGSAQYLAVQDKINVAQKQLNEQNIALHKKFPEEFDAALGRVQGEMTTELLRRTSAEGRAAEAADKAALATIKQNAAMAAGAVQWKVDIGHMSEAEGLRERMALVTEEFAQQETLLTQQIAAQQTLSIINPDALVKVEQLTDELDKLRAARDQALGQLAGQQQSMQWSHTFDGMLYSARNASLELRNIFKATVDSINNDLAGLMAGKKANFKQTLQNAAQSLGKMALNQLEAPLFAKLGLAGGKPDGSVGNPLNVKIVGMPDFGAAAGDVSGGGAAAGVLGVFSKIMGFFGGFKAEGGAIDSASWYVAGEHGPEIIAGVNGRVFNSSEAQRITGHGASYYVDARGANAADVEARVARMLTAVHGSAVRTSLALMQEQARRRPTMQPA